MDTKVGLWIDRKKAIIVFIRNGEIEKKVIKSNVDKQQGRYDGVRSITPYEEKLVPGDDVQQRVFTEHLNVYYDEVISNIRDSGSVYIFGPGESKTELLNRIKKHKVYGTVERIDTSDKLTDPQIIAKVKKFYSE